MEHCPITSLSEQAPPKQLQGTHICELRHWEGAVNTKDFSHCIIVFAIVFTTIQHEIIQNSFCLYS